MDPVCEPAVVIATFELPVADCELWPALRRVANLVVDVGPALATLAQGDPDDLVDAGVEKGAHDAIDACPESARGVVVADVDHGDPPDRRTQVPDRIERAGGRSPP